MEGNYAQRCERLKNRCKRMVGILKLFLDEHSHDLTATLSNAYRQSIGDFDRLNNGLKPFVIGVTGLVASGKSTLLNKILLKEVCKSHDGSCTTIPCLFSHDTRYRITISYCSPSEIQDDLKDIANALKESQNTDKRIKSLILKLAKIFRDFTSLVRAGIDSGRELEPLPNGPIAKIGSPNDSNSFDDLTPALEWLRSFDNFQSVIRHVHIEGPFENIPPGIILCDTPGLGDAHLYNSERTRSLLDMMDECWQLTETSRCLATEEEQLMTRDLLGNNRTLRLIGTKCHQSREGFDENFQTRSFRRNLFLARHNEAELWAMTEEELKVMMETREEIRQKMEQISKVPLAFTEFKDTSFGLETCNQWLAEQSRTQDAKLESAENEFENLLNHIRQLGIEGPEVPPFAPQIRQWNACVQQACDQFLANFRNLHQDIQNDQVQSRAFRQLQISGGWCDNQNSVAAAMRRHGLWRHFDFTGDVSRHWQQLTSHFRIAIINVFNSAVTSLQNSAVGSPLLNGLVGVLVELKTQCLDSCFDHFLWQHVAYLLQPYYVEHSKWYCPAAKKEVYSFKPNEIVTVLNRLYQSVEFYVHTLSARATIIADRLCTPVTFNEIPDLREQFETMLNSLDLPEPFHINNAGGLVCCITLAPIHDPVSLECGHCFERQYISEWFQNNQTCPFCMREVRQRSYLPTRFDLIAHQRFQPRPNPVQERWWEGLWRTIVKEATEEQTNVNLTAAAADDR